MCKKWEKEVFPYQIECLALTHENAIAFSDAMQGICVFIHECMRD